MLWAAASLCFFGFMRLGELTIPSAKSYDAGAHLSFQDVTMDCVHNPRILRVNQRQTLSGLESTSILGPREMDYAQLPPWLVARGPGPGPFFKFEDGSPYAEIGHVGEIDIEIQAKTVGTISFVNTLSAGGVYIRSRAPFPSPREAYIYARESPAFFPLTVRSGRLQAQDLQRQLFLDKVMEPLPILSRPPHPPGIKCKVRQVLVRLYNACSEAAVHLLRS